MYDKDGFKEAFINTMVEAEINKNFKSAATIYFNQAEPVERMYNKDLCDFNIVEIIDLYKYVCTSSVESLLMMNSFLKRYTYFCMESNRVQDGINHYEEVTNDVVISCINKVLLEDKITTRAQLLKTIGELQNPSERFIMLATFEGLAGVGFTDLVDIYPEQFSKYKVKLRSGRELDISKELYNFAIESADEYMYYPEDARDERHSQFSFREDDRRVLKDLYNVKNSASEERQKLNLANKLRRINRRLQVKAYSYGHLVESGRIDLINRTMREQKEPDPRKALRLCKDEMELRYGELQAVGRFIKKYERFLAG